MEPIYRSDGRKIYTEFMDPIQEESKNQSAYRLGNTIYKYLKDTSEKQSNWIKYLIKISPKYHHTLFPTDYFTDANNQLQGVILKDIHNQSSFSSLSTSDFYQNIREIKEEFHQYKKDSILPIDTGYHNSKVTNHTIYLFDTDEFQENNHYDELSCFNYYVYDLLKNILFHSTQSITETQIIDKYFEQIKPQKFCLEYINEIVLNYSTMEEFSIEEKNHIMMSHKDITKRR